MESLFWGRGVSACCVASLGRRDFLGRRGIYIGRERRKVSAFVWIEKGSRERWNELGRGGEAGRARKQGPGNPTSLHSSEIESKTNPLVPDTDLKLEARPRHLCPPSRSESTRDLFFPLVSPLQLQSILLLLPTPLPSILSHRIIRSRNLQPNPEPKQSVPSPFFPFQNQTKPTPPLPHSPKQPHPSPKSATPN